MMQIHPDEITTTKKTPLQLFYDGIRSDATKRDFETKLKKVTCDFLALVLKGDPKKVSKQKTEPKPRKRGIKRQFSDADFEDRVNELVILTREDPEKEVDIPEEKPSNKSETWFSSLFDWLGGLFK